MIILERSKLFENLLLPIAAMLFLFMSRSRFHCALSAPIFGSVTHPAWERPSHPI